MRKFAGRLVGLVCSVMFLGVFLAAQQPVPTSPPGAPLIVATRSEVLFDMVVTDHHGDHVKDLRPSQVEVLDNGVPQQITSFHLVTRSIHFTPQDLRSNGSFRAARLQPRGGTALPAFNLVTLVFGTMSTDGRVLARRAAEAFIRNDLGPNDYAAIYMVDANLYILQGFTRDHARLLEAVNVATGGNSSQFTTMNQQTISNITSLLDSSTASAPSVNGASAGSGASTLEASAHSGEAGAVMASMEQDALGFVAREGTANFSRRMIFALQGIVQGESRLPGRKSVIFFTQRIPVSADTSYLFRNLTAQANRANVTFYVVDPSGLSLESDNAQSAAALRYAAAVSESEKDSDKTGVTFAQANNGQTVEDIQYSSRHMMMSLASSTGGIELGNTNDLAPWMNRIGGDIHSHYELTYASTWGDDGKFHSITVKLKRGGLKVRARNGYYALPPTPDPILPQEAPLFAVLHATPPPHAFRLQQTQWVDPAAPRAAVAVATEFPLRKFTFHSVKLAHGNGVETRFTAMYVVQDLQGKIVAKASEDFPMAGPDSLKLRHMIFMRNFSLAPGLYHLRTILYDPVTSRSTLQTALLSVPSARPGKLRLSSVAVVGRTEPAKHTAGPMVYHGVRLIPTVSDAFQRRQGGRISVYFRLYPGALPSPSVTLLFRRNGKLVARAIPHLAAAHPDGAVPVLSNFALKGFAPGNYEVDVVARAGKQAAFQVGFFSVQ